MRSNYKYYNANPYGAEIEDCVTRAICVATGLKYQAVVNLLDLSADEYNCEKLCVCCYHYLLENILCYTPNYCKDYETVGEVAIKYRDKKVIIRIDGHLTCSLYGTIYDIWDCTERQADIFWIVE